MIDTITLTGGVVAEPELRFTPSGAAVCSFRIAQSDHRKNEAGEWEKTQALYLTVSIWDDRADRRNPVAWAQEAANLTVGQPIAVKGKLITRTWQAKDGTNRSQVEFAATEFYVRPAQSATPAQTGGFGQQTPAPQQHQGATWGTPTPTGQDKDDENPPF